jgi:hypothetical protein
MTDTFWNRVAEKIAKSLPDETCNGVSIKIWWQALQKRIKKLSGCMKQFKLSNQSGTTVEDHLSSALDLYKALSEETLSHLHCYNLITRSIRKKYNSIIVFCDANSIFGN